MRSSIIEDEEKHRNDNEHGGRTMLELARAGLLTILPESPRTRPPPPSRPSQSVFPEMYLFVRKAIKPRLPPSLIEEYEGGWRIRLPRELSLVRSTGPGKTGGRLIVPSHYEMYCQRIAYAGKGRFVYFKDGDRRPHPLRYGFKLAQGCEVMRP